MKRYASGLLCVLIVLCTLVFVLTKAEAATNGITGSCTWSLDGTVLTISGNGKMASYYTNGYFTDAPWGNEVTHVIIENGVINVGQYAFYGCNKLQSASIPGSVKQIDKQAFDRSGIKSISLPEGLTTIYDGAFNSCTSLYSVVLPNSLTHIGDWAFQSCPMTSIVFSKNIKYIGQSAFNYGSITDVWYLGNQSDKAGVTIRGYNACLNTATWHYDSCPIGAPHSYDNECDINCNGCGLLRTVPEHVYESTCDSACNVCGKTRDIEHKYDDACDTKCNICQEKRMVSHFYDGGRVTQNATCGALGIKTFTCTVCTATKTEDIAKTSDHQYGGWIAVNDTLHKRTCSVCSEEETINHTWNCGAVTKKATCKETGVQIYTCVDCGGSREETVPKLLNHTYENDCDSICNICAATRTVTHKYLNSWSKDKTKHWHECSECGNKKDEKKHFAGPEATETAAQKCTICDYIIKASLGHTHKFATEWTTDRNGHWRGCSGCEEMNGYAVHTFENACDTECSICGFVRKTTHKYDEVFKHDETNHWHVCSVCNEKKDVRAHEPGPEATLTTTQTCTICGCEITPALGESKSPTDVTEVGTDAPATGTYTPSGEGMTVFPWWFILIVVSVVIAVVAGVYIRRKSNDSNAG